MKTNIIKDDSIPTYNHKDGIIAKAKRDYQLRILAIDAWLSYVEDVTVELENSFDIEHNLRIKANADIESLENRIKLLEEDPHYNDLLNSYANNNTYKEQTVNSPKLSHTITRSAPSSYTGDLIHGLKDGLGRMVYPDDDPLFRKVYEGSWKNNQNHGKGKMIFTTGDCYDGDWKEGEFHGTGQFVYNDGDVYDGEFVNNMRHGYGVLRSANGSVYKGQWDENYRFGKGELVLEDGTVYKGTFFKNNLFVPS